MAKNPESEFELVLRADYYKEDQYKKFGVSLTNKDVLIIDEASMVELANMDYLLSEVKAAGAKAILIGDNNQLAAIGMTGAFKKASQIVGSNKLTSVMRHKSQDPDVTLKHREATKLLGQYKVNEALEIYDGLGVFNIHKTPIDAKVALVKDYINGYIELAKHLSKDNLSATKSLVIGAYTNAAVNHFNASIREHLKAAGILKGRAVTFRSGNETIELTKGEQIVFLENKPKFQRYYGALNGEVGTVLNFTEHPDEFGRGVFTVLVHKADGSKRIVTISTKENTYPARFKHGYAVTGYKLQGDTATHMMVYCESVMGYEAFNVLMTRHRESVRLYAAEDVLEDVLYGKIKAATEDGTAIARTRYAIEAYALNSENQNKSKIAAWRIGLSAAISRRVDNSFSMDYAAKDTLSENKRAIKSYIESRELTFALRSKLEEWKARVFTPKVLASLRLQRRDIDPYMLLQQSDHAAIWSHISNLAKEELRAIFDEMASAKGNLKIHAKLICDNYHYSADESLTKSGGVGLSVGDLLTQLGINYETLQRHAGYSNYSYYFKEKVSSNSDRDAITSNPHFISMIKLFETMARDSNKTAIDESALQTITDIQKNHAIITEHVSSTKLQLLKAKEELTNIQTKDKAIKDEIDKLTTFTTKLFPEYLSRIYSDNPNDVIAKWDNLVKASGGENALISSLTSRIADNPRLLGKLKGIGFGDILGITEKRQNAIANIEVIAKRFKEYESGKRKLVALKDYFASSEYSDAQVMLGVKTKEVLTLEQAVPSKAEDKILNELSDIFADSNNNHPNQSALPLYDRLKEFAGQDEIQNLIYEHYNYDQDYVQDKSTSIKDTASPSVRKTAGNKKSYNPRITYEQVNSHLTQTHFEQIFRELAHQINEDEPKIIRSGDWINCGSLGMNLKNGTWKRLSTGESGNIYSFVSTARNLGKLEALEFIASIAGGEHEYDCGKYQHDRYSKRINGKVSSTNLNQANTPTDQWIAYNTIPQDARAMNPNNDFSWMLKTHDTAETYEYQNIEGNIIGGTIRFINKTSKDKQVIPYAYCKNEATNQSAWRFKGFLDHGYKPIYGIEKVNHDKRTILIVEGEKTADAAQRLFPEYAVMSWFGGSGSVDKANWSQLKGRSIVIFPDNDTPGKSAAVKILNHINIANDKIGYASIVDLATIGKGYNPFPEKWDLADELPKDVTINDIKHAIESTKHQARNIPKRLELRSRAIEENLTQISSPELLGQYKYLEAKGIASYSHEFLKPEHGLYRDTLACLVSQVTSQESQRDFIAALESEYEKLISRYNHSAASYLEHYDSLHQKHEKALETHGKDRIELYKTIVRDVTLLHSLGLKANTEVAADKGQLPKLTKTHCSMIADQVYSAIDSYKRPFSKRMQRNDLATQEKITIAETVHTKTTASTFWQAIAASQTIEPTITKGILRRDLGLAFDRIVQVGISKQPNPVKQLTVLAEDVEVIRQKAFKEAAEVWLINNRQSLTETEYELCVHRAVFELKATRILNNSLDFDVAQIAGKNIENNPYSKLLASIISHEEIYINEQGKVVKSSNKLASVIDKRDLVLKAHQIFEARNKRIEETLNLNTIIPKATNDTEELTNRILAEHITDHEMIYGKGNITTEKFVSMHEIAKHEALLEIAMRQEWGKHEAKAHNAQKAKTAAKGLSKRQMTSDIDTSIAVARHGMRNEMNWVTYHHTYFHNEHNNHSRHASLDHDIAHHHMDSYQNSLHQIATDHHAHIHDHIAQFRNLQAQLKSANSEGAQELQRQVRHNRGMGMSM